jgi:hypothetical protein
VEVWNCGKISLILFCTQREQAGRKKEQAMYKRNGEKISLILFLHKKEQADRKKDQAKYKLGGRG